MIAHLNGQIILKENDHVVIDVNGVGYSVFVSSITHEQMIVGDVVHVHTSFVVRENAQELFGFLSVEEKTLFELLRSVSGVGPKVALSILGLGAPQQIESAIAGENTRFIVGASGVGKRVAEKVIVELRDKVSALADGVVASQPVANDDAFEALIALGYNPAQAQKALQGVEASKTEDRIKAALKELK